MRCQRCLGCMVREHFMDVLNVSGEMDFTGWRCVNCGDITDPIIVRHHQSAANPPAKSRRRWWGHAGVFWFVKERRNCRMNSTDDCVPHAGRGEV